MSNDIGSGITTQGTLTIGQSVQSDLEGLYDTDWFKTTLEAGKAYTFTLNGRDQDGGDLSAMSKVELDVFDSKGALLSFNFSPSNYDPIRLTFLAGQTGSYFIGASSSWGYPLGSYTLLSAELPTVNDDIAQNTTTKGVITPGQLLQGTFDAVGDYDWYKFHAEAGQQFKVTYSRDAGMVLPSTFMVYDAKGAVQTGYPFEASVSGDYFLSLRGNQTGKYGVTLAPLVDDYTAGNSAPGHLAMGATVSGAIQFSGDVDRFLVQVEAGKIYTFALSADSTLLANLSLSASDGAAASYTLDTLSNANGVRTMSLLASKDGVVALDVRPNYQWTGVEGHYSLSASTPVTDDVGDSISGATLVALDQSVSGKIDSPSDSDMFRLDLTAGQSYVLQLDSVSAGAVKLTPGAANSPAGDFIVQGLGQPYSFVAANSTPLYVQVTGASRDLSGYSFSVRPASDDFSANADSTGRLSLTQPASGKSDFASDRDWFGMALDAGTTYWFTLKGEGGGANTAFNLYAGQLRVLDAAGHVLASQSDKYNSPSTLSFTPASKGNYYIEVAGAKTLDGSSQYQLQAQVGIRDDFGNDAAHAAPLVPGVTRSGAIEVWGDVDVFKMSVTAGNTYGLQLAGAEIGGHLKVSDASGHDVQLNAAPYGVQLFSASSTGDYYISVYPDSAPTGKGQYQLSATSYGSDDVGDTASKAAVLPTGGKFSAALNFPNDKDYFKVHLDAGRAYAFDLLGSAGGGGTLRESANSARITLSDSSDRFISSSVYGDSSSSSPHLSYIAGATGDYYIQVESGGTGSYTLVNSVTSLDQTAPALVSATPSSGLGLNSNIVLAFDELITLSKTPDIRLTDSTGNSFAFVNGTGVVTGQTITFDPYFNLQPGMSYTLHIGAGSLLDMAGNQAAIPQDLRFTTVPAVNAATSGNDYLLGTGTGSVLEGGDGVDTVYYGDMSYRFYVSRSDAGYSVYRSGAATPDTLHGIERILFKDSALALDVEGHGGQAYRLYQAAFDRTPDQSGLGFWIAALDKGLSLQAVAQGFVKSAEFQSLYGSAPSDAQFVSQLYHNVLHRDGDTGGSAFWQDVLQHGSSREAVLVAFSESAENQAALIGVIGKGFNYIPQA